MGEGNKEQLKALLDKEKLTPEDVELFIDWFSDHLPEASGHALCVIHELQGEHAARGSLGGRSSLAALAVAQLQRKLMSRLN